MADENPVIDCLVRELEEKRYLGDGAYMTHDGYHIVLYTSNGISETNRVCLEPTVLQKFLDELARVKDLVKEINRLREKEKE